jgi:hypothetical protein
MLSFQKSPFSETTLTPKNMVFSIYYVFVFLRNIMALTFVNMVTSNFAA